MYLYIYITISPYVTAVFLICTIFLYNNLDNNHEKATRCKMSILIIWIKKSSQNSKRFWEFFLISASMLQRVEYYLFLTCKMNNFPGRQRIYVYVYNIYIHIYTFIFIYNQIHNSESYWNSRNLLRNRAPVYGLYFNECI